MNPIFRKTVCSVISGLFFFTQTSAFAASYKNAQDAGMAGSQFGNALGKSIGNSASWSDSGVTFSMKGENGKKNKYSFDSNSMSSNDSSNKSGKYKSSTTTDQLNSLSGNWQNVDAIEATGNERKTELNKNAKSQEEALAEANASSNAAKSAYNVYLNDDTTSIEGAVFQIIKSDAQSDRSANLNMKLDESSFANSSDYAKELYSKANAYSGATQLQRANDVLSNLSEEIAAIMECKESENLASTGEYKHVQELKICQQLVDRTTECIINHNYGANVLEYYDGTMKIESCGTGCLIVRLGDASKNNNIGDAGTYTYAYGSNRYLYIEDVYMRVLHPEAITKAELYYASFDDMLQIWLGPNGSEKKIYQGRAGYPWPIDEKTNKPTGRFEYNHTWLWNPTGNGPKELLCESSGCRPIDPDVPPYDVTQYLKGTEQGGLAHFMVKLVVGRGGDVEAGLRIYYDPSKIDANDTWLSSDCVIAAQGYDEGYATAGATVKGGYTCTSMPKTVQTSRGLCAKTSGYESKGDVCESDLAPSPLKNISNLCRRVKVDVKYDYYKGGTAEKKEVLVGYEADGTPITKWVTPEAEEMPLDECKEYEKDDACVFVESKCSEDASGSITGTCYINDVTYDCGRNVKVSTDTKETTTECDGIACAGDECLDLERTYSTSFGKVAALTSMVDDMAEDMDCTGIDNNGNLTGEPVACQVFKGDAKACRVYLKGYVKDCCKNPDNDDLYTYVKALYKSRSNLSMTKAITDHYSKSDSDNDGTTVANDSGSWTDMQGEPEDALKSGADTSTSKSFNSSTDTNTGNTEKNQAQDSSTYSSAESSSSMKNLQTVMNDMQAVMGITTKLTSIVVPTDIKSLVALIFLGETWMYIKTILVILEMFARCDEDESDLKNLREAKKCHFVGSWTKKIKIGIGKIPWYKEYAYCCYNSILGRILHEQIRISQPELLSTWGNAKNPKCGGISTDDIDKIDFDKIDLSEYEAILMEDSETKIGSTSTFDGSSAMPSTEAQTSIMKLSGADALNNYNGHDDAITSTERKLSNIDVDGIHDLAQKCYPLSLGDGETRGGDCIEASADQVECRKNGSLVSCDSISKNNMLNDLMNAEKSNESYYNNGTVCYRNGEKINCSYLYDEDLSGDVLEEYAELIGGTTYRNEYVCTDSTGQTAWGICQKAQAAACDCTGSAGNYVCRKGNQIVDCNMLTQFSTTKCQATCSKTSSASAEWGEWVVDVEATCATSGSKHKENKLTGEIVTEIIVKSCDEEAYEKERDDNINKNQK